MPGAGGSFVIRPALRYRHTDGFKKFCVNLQQQVTDMRKQLSAYIVIFTVVIFFSACGTLRETTPSQIGLLPLDSYNLAATTLSADTTYRVIRSEEEFRATATPSDAAARQPAFSGQMVVAILFKNAVTSPLRFDRAELTGSTMNVYASTCTGQNCGSSQAVLATTPRVGSVKRVQFIINGENKTLVNL